MKTDLPRSLLVLCLATALLPWAAHASAPSPAPAQPPAATTESPDPEMAKLNRNIAANPSYPFAYTVRGSLKKARGDLDGALADFNKAVSLEPGNAGAYNNRGLVKQARHDLPGAAADFTQALEFKPSYTDAWYNRGRVRKAAGDLDGALSDYNRALELDPHYSDAWLRRGNVKKAKNDVEGALSDFRLCYKFSGPHWKDYARINLWLGRVAKGEKAAASAVLSTYLIKRTPNGQGDWAAKIMEFLLDKIDEPSFINMASARSDPGVLCQAWYYAGMKRLLSGDKIKATEDFNKCRATQKWDYDEYQYATAELKALGV